MNRERLQTFSIVFVGLIVCAFIVGYDFFLRDPIIVYKVDMKELEKMAQDKKLDINTATLEDLMTIEGIGKVTAQRIIDYREQHNGFKFIEELKEIKGISDNKYANFCQYLAVM